MRRTTGDGMGYRTRSPLRAPEARLLHTTDMPTALPRRRIVTLLAVTASVAMSAGAQDPSAVIELAERDRGALNSAGALGRLETALAPRRRTTSCSGVPSVRRPTSASSPRTPRAVASSTRRRSSIRAGRSPPIRAGRTGTSCSRWRWGAPPSTSATRERVKYAADIRTAAMDAIRLDPGHAGALHVLGIWNAEIMRLNGMARFVARNFLGGKVFEQASWAEARRNLELAVANDPGRITHRAIWRTSTPRPSDPVKARRGVRDGGTDAGDGAERYALQA